MRPITLRGAASLLILLAFSVSRADALITFNASQRLTVNVGPDVGLQSTALVDVNRDTFADILVLNTDTQTVQLFLNDGSGRFDASPSLNFGTGDGPVAVSTGDFNRDGSPDLVIVNTDAESVTVYLGDGTGNFNSPRDFNVDPNPLAVVAVDLDNDLYDDLAVLSDTSVYVLKSNRDGTFSPFATPSIDTRGQGAAAIAAGKFVGANVDLAISNADSGDVSVLLGNGDGSFKRATLLASVGDQPDGIAIADLNGDAKQDIAVVAAGAIADLNVSLLFGDGTGNFNDGQGGASGSHATTTAIEQSIGIAAADLDGDGTIDLGVSNIRDGGAEFGILCQQSPKCNDRAAFENGFQLQSITRGTSLGEGQIAIRAGKINNDGLADLIALGQDGSLLGVFLNTTGTEPTVAPTTPGTAGPSPTPTPSPTGPTSTPAATSTPTATVTPTSIPTAPYGVCNTNLPGGSPMAVAVGDFNRDGSPDIAVADNQGNRVTILAAHITREPPQMNPDPCAVLNLTSDTTKDLLDIAAPRALAAADIDGDGKLDLAVVGSGGLTVLFGDGSGGFAHNGPQAAGTTPQSVAVADFNRDGILDVIVANADSPNASIFLGTGQRGFTSGCAVPVGRAAGLIASQDLNRDGRADFAVASVQTDDLAVLLNKGVPVTPVSCGSVVSGFSGVTPLGLAAAPRGIVADNFELNDVVPDLAAALADGRVLLFFGRTTGGTAVSYQLGSTLTVGAPVGSALPAMPSAIVSADVNHDGRTDLAIADSNNNTVVIFQASVDAKFGSSLIPLPISGVNPVAMTVADIDGDGRPDIVTANAGNGSVGGSVSILVSSRPPPTPTPTQTFTPSITPTPADTATPTPPGTSTITPMGTRTRSVTPTFTVTLTPTQRGKIALNGSCAVDPSADRNTSSTIILIGMAAAGLLGRYGPRGKRVPSIGRTNGNVR